MVWARLDDAFPDHPKVDVLSDAAFRLHVAALCFANRMTTDGQIDGARALRLTMTAKPKVVRELVMGGLWHEQGHVCPTCPQPGPGSYWVHDFLDCNPSRAEVDAKREAERIKKQRQRSTGSAAVDRGSGGRFVSPAPSPDLSPGDSRGESSATRPDPTPPPPQVPPPTGATDLELRAEARRRLANRPADDPVRDEAAWTRRCITRLRIEGWTPDRRPAVPDAHAVIAQHHVPDTDIAPPPPGYRPARTETT